MKKISPERAHNSHMPPYKTPVSASKEKLSLNADQNRAFWPGVKPAQRCVRLVVFSSRQEGQQPTSPRKIHRRRTLLQRTTMGLWLRRIGGRGEPQPLLGHRHGAATGIPIPDRAHTLMEFAWMQAMRTRSLRNRGAA